MRPPKLRKYSGPRIAAAGFIVAGLSLPIGLHAQEPFYEKQFTFDQKINLNQAVMKAFKGKDYDTAIKYLGELIDLSPKDPEPYLERGSAYGQKGEYDKAIADFDQVIRLNPNQPDGYGARGLTFYLKGNYARFIADLKQGISLSPSYPGGYNELAWFLATGPQAQFRNGREAVKYAKKACELSAWKDAHYVDTLAAAYAETGDFDSAVKWESLCLVIPGKDGRTKSDTEDRLKLYQAHMPYHADK